MPRQQRLPGIETIKEIDDAADAYVKERDKRQKQTEKEVGAKDALIAVMKQHRKTVYKDADADPPLIVTLTPGKDTVKVTRDESDDESENGDGEE